MTPKEYAQLLEFLKENNSWGMNMYTINHERNRKAVKYVDCCFDSRDGLIWSVTFRSVTGESDKTFRIESREDVQKIYDWLDEPLYRSGATL